MCFLCGQANLFDTHLDLTSDSSRIEYTETSDATGNSSTSYAISVGDSFRGSLGTFGDRDWIEITLQAGEIYTVSIGGAGSGDGTLADSFLRVYDGSSVLVGSNDDGGAGYDSALSFEATTTGTYYISVGSFADSYTGSYLVETSVFTPAAPGTLDEMATYLTNGFWGGTGFQFDTSTSNVITVDITGLTADGQQLARWAMQAWEAVADISFLEVSSGAQITFDDDQSGAFAGPNSVTNGFTDDATVNVGTGWLSTYGTSIDSYSFLTYIHEIGHALGLGHQGPYNGSATYGLDEAFSNDSWQLSIMSYFDQDENTTVNADAALVMTAMMVDIIAIQNLYGASTVTAGNTTWGLGSSFGTYFDDLMDAITGGTGNGNVAGTYPVAFTIFDAGGTDTLDLSFTTLDSRLDMRAESFSDIGSLIGNLGIARGTWIENALIGSGNDTVTGNGLGNHIDAGDGNDQVWAREGNDTVLGGLGNDTIGGAAGDDSLSGGDGNDELWGAGGRDTLLGGDGDDTLGGGAWDDSLEGGDGHDSLSGGTGLDTILGGEGDDSIDGWAHIDEIHGGAGNDYIVGGNWGDTIYGDDGDDLIFADGDTRIPNNYTGADYVEGGAGNDTIVGGTGADTLLGQSGNDTIWGGDGWNVLDGGADDDRLVGGVHVDRLIGGDGYDSLIGNAGADTFVFTTGTRTDRVADFSLAEGDRLELDDALWTSTHGTLTTAEVISNFGAIGASGHIELIFAGGERIILQQVVTTTGLDANIDIV